MLTKRQLEVLQRMAAAEASQNFEEAEIVQEGLVCYLGLDRISCKTVKALIEHVLISLERSGTFCRWTINEAGHLVAKNPALADEIWLAVQQGRPITFDDDKIIYLDESP